MSIKLLDCTLRDGGHVNNADFGKDNIKAIISGLVKAELDYIELGFLRDGAFSSSQALYNDIKEVEILLPEDKKNSNFALMIRPDWYDIRQLSESNGKIDIIRFAFYYKDFELMKEHAKIVKDKGYRYICNPVNIVGYTEYELLELIEKVNDLRPEQLTIVDTYGALTYKKLKYFYNIIEENLQSDIRIGLHLHENQSLSFGLAQEFLKMRKKERDVVIDGSLMGMGRIPGNLCIELICEYMNNIYGNRYNTDEIYNLIGQYIQPIREKVAWGYSPAYYITAKYEMHRSYAEFLLQKEDLSLNDINKILKQITEKKYRDEFYKEYIEMLYDNYRREKNE